MTDPNPEDLGGALARERLARLQAEALLADRTRDLSEVSRHMILESEAVRAALAETEALRRREARALHERTIVTAALTALTSHDGADGAMQALLTALCEKFGILDACFVQADQGRLRIAAAARTEHAGLALPLPDTLLSRSRRLVGLTAATTGPDPAAIPGSLAEARSVLISPLGGKDGMSGALLLACLTEDRFSASDLRTLERVAQLATQTLLRLREARRNALLVSLLEGRPVAGSGTVLDDPLEAVHRAFDRMTQMQGQVVGILDRLLTVPISQADAGIDDALAQMGRMTRLDRVYVFRILPEAGRFSNTHEWCAPGISPMRDRLQDLPLHMIAHWHARFTDGTDVMIPDVAALPDAAPEKQNLTEQGIRSLLAVPLMIDGALAGFVGFDAVRDLHTFLPGETHLIRSVTKVIAAVMARHNAEANLGRAHALALAQRQRLEAVLSAMPDLVIELDRARRFVKWHSGAVQVPQDLAARLSGRQLTEALPPFLSDHGQQLLDRLDAGEATSGTEIRFALDPTAPARDWQVTASRVDRQGYLFVMRDITAARARSAHLQRLSEIARRTTNLVIVTDARRRIEWVNAAFTRKSGWSLDEVRGQSPGKILHCDETDPETVSRIRSALDRGQPIQTEILNRARDGQVYWIAMDIQPLLDDSGEVKGFMAVQTDITERRQHAQALQRAAQDAARARSTLEAAVEALHDGFVLYDAEDRLVLCNKNYRDFYPRSAPAIVPGARFEDILRYGLARREYAEAIGREEDWLAERMIRHRAASSELEQELADGRWLRIFEQATPDGGRVGLRIDITALKQAQQRALADRFAVMDASGEGIALTDAGGSCLYLNPELARILDLPMPDTLIGSPWQHLFPPEVTATIATQALPALSTQARWTCGFKSQTASGMPLDITLTLTRREAGEVIWLVRDHLRNLGDSTARCHGDDCPSSGRKR